MRLYHLIDRDTNLVTYADKPETGELVDVASRNPEFIVVESTVKNPNSPRILPGFLYHNGIFWAPQTMANQVTMGNINLDREDFLRLLTLEESLALYNYQENDTITEKTKSVIRAFLRYLDSSSCISLSNPILLNTLSSLEESGHLSGNRKSEILTLTFRQ